MFLLATLLIGPTSDHKYSFGSSHRGHSSRGHHRADWSWLTGSDGRGHRSGGSLLSGRGVSWF